MKTAKEIREYCNSEIKKLQENCPHKETQEVYEAFGPGHITGRIFETCKACEKVLVIRGANMMGFKKIIDTQSTSIDSQEISPSGTLLTGSNK